MCWNRQSKVVLAVVAAVFLILVLGAIFVADFLKRDNEPYLGMPRSNFVDCYQSAFNYLNYAFYEKENGDGVVVHFETDTGTIDDIRIYSKDSIKRTKENFEKIKGGMSLYEVVSMVGIPCRTNTSGPITMVFATEDGEEYSIYFRQSDSDELVVYNIIALK